MVCVGAAGLTASAQPSNDPCGSAINHEIPPFGGIVEGTVVDATNDGAGCGSNRLPAGDVYHSFVPATRGPWRFDLCDTASGWDTVLSIHRDPINPAAAACPTTSTNRIAGGCDDDGCNPFFGQAPSVIRAVSLEPGVRYTIRIAGFDAGSLTDTYTLAATDLNVTNDRCEDAGQSPISGAGGVIFGELTDATTDGAVDASTCLQSIRAASVRDVYHLFTPQTSGRWTITTCISGQAFPADTVVSIHTGCPASAANTVACNNDGCESRAGSSVVSADLLAGVTYRIRVAEFINDRFNALLGVPQYALSVTSEPTGRCCSPSRGTCEVISQSACAFGNSFTPGEVCSPLGGGAAGSCGAGSYNDCSQAINLVLDETVFASTAGLTGVAAGSCTSLTADGWFTFTAPQDGTYQLFAEPAVPMLGLVASVFSGAACPTNLVNELECGFIFGNGVRFSLLGGQSVKIRIAATDSGRFSIRVSFSQEAPPANDLCPQATPVVRGTAVQGTFNGSSGALPVEGCSSGQRDVWFSYTAPSTERTRVVVTPAPGSQLTAALSVSTACSNARLPLACAGEPFELEQPSEITFAAAAGTNYRFRVSTNSEVGDFSLLVTQAPPAPANDACTSAQLLPLDTSVAGTTRFASASGAAISVQSCSTPESPDTWFRFRPTSAGAYEITVTPNTPQDAGIAIAVFAACPSGGTQDITCTGQGGAGDPTSLRFLGAANVDYFIRTSSYVGEGSDFTIGVSTSQTPLGACCARDGGCFTASPDDCTVFSGIYQGDNVACAVANCAPSGRCCFSGSSSCIVTAATFCTGPGTTFTAGASCFPTTCPTGTAPANDLCVNAPTLSFPAIVLTGLDLADAEGPAIPAGFCSTSQSHDLGLDRSVYFRFVAPITGTMNMDIRFVDFPEPMVVLYRGNSCNQLLDVDCTFRFQAGERRTFEVDQGLTYYLGVGIRNDPDLVNSGGLISFLLAPASSNGACCRGSGCAIESSDSCTATGGVFQGSATVCGTPGNPTTCCRANFNGLGGVTVQDIFDFLSAYFTGNPAADFNNSGSITVQDIFDYLLSYFIGCSD